MLRKHLNYVRVRVDAHKERHDDKLIADDMGCWNYSNLRGNRVSALKNFREDKQMKKNESEVDKREFVLDFLNQSEVSDLKKRSFS